MYGLDTRLRRKRRVAPRLAALAVIAAALPASPLAGQIFQPGPADETTVQIQLEKPFLANADDVKFFTSVLDVDLSVPVGDGLTLVLGAPLAVGGADPVGNGAFLGNLRGTLVFGEPGDQSGFLGLTLPTATDFGDGAVVGAVAGLAGDLDRIEEWVDDSFGVRAALTPSWDYGEGRRLGLRLGVGAAAPDDFDDVNVYLRPGVWGIIRSGSLDLRGDLATSYFLNSDDGFGEQFTAYLDLGVDLVERSGRPGFFVRIPLDGDTRDLLNLSVGARVRF